MFTTLRTEEFDHWLGELADLRARARILARIRSAEHGNPGDIRHVGEGVCAMRLHLGPGYRVYFKRIGSDILLLGAGTKSSQHRDIVRAIAAVRNYEASHHDNSQSV